MSHNNPYRRQPPDSDLRPDPGSHSSSDRRHASHNFYRAPQESFSSSYPTSSSNSSPSSSRGAQGPQDGALSILSSCGLEPSDLALLAELPEDVLTVESLPHVLQQIKGKRGTVKPFPPNAPSPSSTYAHSSARRRAVSPSTGDWDRPHSQLLQYPLDHLTHSPLPSDLDRWGNPRTSSSVGVDPPPPPPSSSSSSSSSSSYMVDFHHRPGPSEYSKTSRNTGPVSSQDFHHRSGPPGYGKTSRDARPVSSQDQASLSFAGGDKKTRPSRFSQPEPAKYRSAPPPEENHPKTHRGCHETESSSSKSSSRQTASLPSKQEALDFHGSSPPMFPYSCCLCNITVMSEKVWIQHINGTNHADGQLSLLQQFPNWDCRVETVTRADNQSEKWKDEGEPGWQPQPANRDSMTQPNKRPHKKPSEKGKVVCVKFPAQSVDETHLRKLTEPFGRIVKIVMFPSLAFVELGSVDQANDLVTLYSSCPPTVNGEQIEFSISKTFSFLQSSRVVSFTPAPTGQNGLSDLICIVKRFGPPLYTLFLPSRAFVEMKNTPDAQKLVDFYSSNSLRINNDVIQVSFSGEYKSLLRVASAKRYEEEPTKRTRSSSREKEDKMKKSSKGREEERKTRTRSKSREKSTEKRTRTRSRSRSRDKFGRVRRTRTRSKSNEKSSRERRSRSRSRSRDKFGRVRRTRTRSKSNERSSREKRSRSKSRSRGKSAVQYTTESTDGDSRTDPDPAPARDSEAEAEAEDSEDEAELSAEESDIEGMEVIGEDGENLEGDDMETLDDADEEEEDDEGNVEEAAEKDECSAERTDSSKDEEEETKDGEAEDLEQQREKEQPDFPVDLENCITLDELEEEQSDDEDEAELAEPKSPSTRVVHFRNLPLRSYTDTEFTSLVRDFGTAVRFYHEPPSCGFIEMSSSSEALRAVEELSSKPVTFNSSKLLVQISDKYKRLTNGRPVPLDEDSDEEKRSEHRSQSSRRSERLNRNIKSEGRKESSKKTPEEESMTKKAPEEESRSKKAPEEESTSKKAPEEGSRSEKAPEEESRSKKAPEEESTSKESPKTELTSEKSPENMSMSKTVNKMSPEKAPVDKRASEKMPRTTPENESANEKTPEESADTSKKTIEKQIAEKEKDSAAAKKSPEKETFPETLQEQKTVKRKATCDDSAPEKKKKESKSDETPRKQELEAAEAPAEEKLEIHEKEGPGPGLEDVESPDPSDSTGDPPKPQTEQICSQKQDSQVQVEQSGPAGGATELQKPTKPVGAEFVRPVVGYFCHLCQLIYADEDEAKLQHCSSLTHYRKYQEKTGKDPWLT
ncbi:matrin 3-like 1.1 isoform X3 [Chelmon rostratus]|uniref:matrin 3-like 1.1 isoform X3 n=1 Tax=Chelmon rostratus TaxID=109905 RepID=UPI001BEB0A7A|nr:matrin 3-like 1.1 isoform X3 [Chelmon rostratus]